MCLLKLFSPYRKLLKNLLPPIIGVPLSLLAAITISLDVHKLIHVLAKMFS
jgi:uncharacterized protein YggT (Ycf19 family)